MSEGRVKWFNDEKVYGFIETREHGDVFVHCSAITADRFRSSREGERMSFEVERGPKGPEATDAKIGLTLASMRYPAGGSLFRSRAVIYQRCQEVFTGDAMEKERIFPGWRVYVHDYERKKTPHRPSPKGSPTLK